MQDQRIRDLKEIPIVIDSWDDIFSDFDPRPLGERILSEDFIIELKRRYRESKTGNFIVTICAPIYLKDEKAENTVLMRLKKHFRHHLLQRQKEITRLRIRGVIFVAVGISFLTFLLLITYFKVFSELTIEMLSIIFMPLGWFGIWEGFSKLVDASPGFIKEEVLFNKLSKATYRFQYIENTPNQ